MQHKQWEDLFFVWRNNDVSVVAHASCDGDLAQKYLS